jgi:hypothetical protein
MTVDMGAVCPREPIENLGARLHSWSAVGLHLPGLAHPRRGMWSSTSIRTRRSFDRGLVDLEQFDAAVDE